MKRHADPLGNRLNLERIGASGHDFGAQTALALAGQVLPGEIAIVEPRVKAVVAMGAPVPLGQVPLSVAYRGISVPCLHITGTDDNSIVATTQASQRRLPFDYTQGVDEYLIIFQGADHRTYSGHPFPRRNGWADGVFQHLIAQSSTAFWDAYLKGDADAKRWLADGGLRAMLAAKATLEKKTGR
jgi:predicted dienelactone hydrolase